MKRIATTITERSSGRGKWICLEWVLRQKERSVQREWVGREEGERGTLERWERLSGDSGNHGEV